jgi:M6 family metalloprotease-like protein
LLRFVGIIIALLFFLGCQSQDSSEDSQKPSSPSKTDSGKVEDEQTGLKPSSSPVSIDESRPLLVIRINYNNIKFQNDAYTWSKKIFGYNEHELNHYYQEISCGHFNFAKVNENEGSINDGIITVNLNKDHPDSGVEPTIHSDLSLALKKADAFINYKTYDKNSDGNITPDELIVVFIVAGDEDAFAGPTNELGVWAHESCTALSNTPLLDNVYLLGCKTGGNYVIFGERHHLGNYNTDATIGIIAHELGHAAFDLPDLYDTSGQSAGIGYFGLMAGGMWAQEDSNDPFGNTPVHMSAWSKLHNHWITADIASNISLQQMTLTRTSSKNYNIVKLPINSHEYFLLENRDISGYDKGLLSLHGEFNGGLAIWHIDQDIIDMHFTLNKVNSNKFHKGVDLEEADKAEIDYSRDTPGHANNLFYYGNKTSFTPNTSPNSNSYKGGNSGIVINNISYPGEIMSTTVTNPNRRF